MSAKVRSTPLVSLLGASGISLIGDLLTAIAVPWFVLQTTGSASRTGLTAAATVLPTVVVGIFGGALVDRFGHRRTSIVSDVASGATVAMVPVLHLTVGIEFWQLLVLMFFGGILDVPGRTARQSLLPELANQSNTPLERANSAFSSLERGAGLVGPMLAGLLIAVVGPANVLFVNAGTFLLSALIVSMAVPTPRGEAVERDSTANYLDDLKEGFQFVRHDSVALTILIVAALVNFLSNPLAAVVLPVYANRVFGDAVNLGVILAGLGGGALLSAITYGAIGHKFSRRRIFVAGFLVLALPLGALSLQPGLAGTVTATFLLGVATGPLQPIAVTVIQERTPAHLRGRVFGLMAAGSWAILPMGMLTAGFLLETIGLQVTLAVMALGFLVLSLSVLLTPTLRQMDEPSLDANEPAESARVQLDRFK